MTDAPLLPVDKAPDQDGSGMYPGTGGRCPLPAEPLGLDALTSSLCGALGEAGCPLAPAVQQRLRFEALLAELSAIFVNLPPSHVDSRINDALRRLVEFLGVDRGGLAELLIDQKQMVITHSYHLPGVPAQARTIVSEQLPWYARMIFQGEVLRLSRLPDDLPAEATHEREYCSRVGLKSHVMIPLRVMDSVVGAIGFASFRGDREWPDDLVQRLRLVGEIFANALARKQAEEKLHHLRDQLARVARVTAVGELAAAVAHEVNQPLCAIVSNAQAAQRLLASDVGEVREILQDITAEARRASDVITRIRSMLQKREPVKAPIDVNAAIRDVVALAQHQLTRKRLSLSLDLAADLPPALGDRVQLQQVVLNLMLNAVEAASHGAHFVGGDQGIGGVPPPKTPDPNPRQNEVSVASALAETGELVIAVRDTGPGITPEHAGCVFDPFFTTKPGGIGIGLSISRSIVEAHGGRIWAVSKPGGGASFLFTLPTAPGGLGIGIPRQMEAQP
jgi:signal transduction histidine kinase